MSAVCAVGGQERGWLLWIDRMAVARADQIARRFELPVGYVRVRLSRMQAAGLVEKLQPAHEDRTPHGPVAWVVSKKGRWLSQSPLPAPQVSSTRCAHALEVVDAVIGYELDDYDVLTEAEIRRHGRQFLARGHRPDAVVDPWGQADGPVAVEVERGRKGEKELRGIFLDYAWVGSPFRSVHWFAAPGACASLRALVDRLGNPAREWADTTCQTVPWTVTEWGTASASVCGCPSQRRRGGR